jgi:hypothetical protein
VLKSQDLKNSIVTTTPATNIIAIIHFIAPIRNHSIDKGFTKFIYIQKFKRARGEQVLFCDR